MTVGIEALIVDVESETRWGMSSVITGDVHNKVIKVSRFAKRLLNGTELLYIYYIYIVVPCRID